MATVDADAGEGPAEDGAPPTARQGAAAVVATSALNAASTVLVLALATVLVETNHIPRAFSEMYGVLPTVVLLSVVLAGTVVIVTELAAWTVRERDRWGSFAGGTVRLVGYGTPSVISLDAATNSVVLIVEHTPIALTQSHPLVNRHSSIECSKSRSQGGFRSGISPEDAVHMWVA